MKNTVMLLPTPFLEHNLKSLLLILDSMIHYDREVLKGIKAKLDESKLRFDIHVECPKNMEYIQSCKWDYVIADLNKPQVEQFIETSQAKTVIYSNHQLAEQHPLTDHKSLSRITLDNSGLANTALQAFLNQNIPQVGYFANQQDRSSLWSMERENAFLDAATKSGLQTIEQIEHAIESGQFPLGIYCSSDRSARRIANVCQRHKVKVPEQVSIIGTDSDDAERALSPMPLSSVELNPFHLGKLCVDVLRKTIRFKRPLHVQFSSFELCHAETTSFCHKADAIVVKAQSFMRRKFESNIKIKQVTDFCGVSRKTLDMRFIEHQQQTAHQYLTELRLTKAQYLLRNTTVSVDSVAKQCGYPGQSYLCQLFNKQIGLSPLQYRQQFTH